MKLFVLVTSESETSDSLIQLFTLNDVDTVDEFHFMVNTVEFMKNYAHVQTSLRKNVVQNDGVHESYIDINDVELMHVYFFVANEVGCSTKCMNVEDLHS